MKAVFNTSFASHIIKKFFISFLFLTIILALSHSEDLNNEVKEISKRPNVLLIIVDTLRADYLSCYGNTEVKTPNIDKLAAEGIMFSQAVSHVPLTLPSHTSIFTGTYPFSHGVRDNGSFRLDDKLITIAEILKENGYHTAAFVGAFPVDSRFGIAQGFDLYDDYYGEGSAYNDFAYAERRAEEVIKPAIEWLKKSAAAPWFCWLHFYDPHMPYIPPAPYNTLYANNPYAGEIAYTDEVIGKFFAFLQKENLDKNLLIIFTSDHGEGLGDHGEGTHGLFAYNATLHIPLIWCDREIFSQPQVINKRVRHIDIAPTLLDLLDIEKPAQMQGRSLIPLIQEPSSWIEDESYFETLTANLNRNWAPLYGLFKGNYKYIKLPIPELYDMRRDSQEENNIYPQYSSIAEKMNQHLSELIESSAPGSLKQTKIDEETRKKLMALGYLTPSSRPSAKKEYTEEDDPKRLIKLNEMLNEAIAFYLQKENRASIELLQQVLRQRPDFTLAYINLSYIQEQSGLIEDAIATLQGAVNKGIRDISIMSKLGIYLQDAGQFQRSAAILESAAQQDAQNFEVLNYLGIALTRLEEYEKAAVVYNKLLRIDSSFAPAYNNMGSLYLAQKDYNKAISYLEKALAYDAHNAQVHNGLGVAFANLNQYEKAVNYWKKAIEFDAGLYDTLYNLGTLLTKLERYEEAIPYLEQFVNSAPDYKYQADKIKIRKLISLLKSRHER
jgi:arylsulfatase A-like enzyme/tetratricopeptide (TPR) repeat protein